MIDRQRIIRAARVYDPDPTDVNAILVEDGRIARVGALADLSASAPDAEVVDVRTFSVTPGFVDTHVHITGSGLRTAVDDRRTDSVEVQLLRAAGNGATALSEGVTTLRDCGARNEVIFEYRAAAQRGVLAAPRVLASGSPLTRTGGHGDMWGGEVDTPDEVRRIIRRQSKLGADCLKVMVDMGLDGSRKARPGLPCSAPTSCRGSSARRPTGACASSPTA